MYLLPVLMVYAALIAMCYVVVVGDVIALKKRRLLHMAFHMQSKLHKKYNKGVRSIYEAPLGCLELDRLESSRKSLAAAQKTHNEVNRRMKKVKIIANIICFILILMLSILAIFLVFFIPLLIVSILN